MPTYLDLCKKVHKLAQVQGAFSSVSEAGINSEIAAIVSQSWVDIQQLRGDFDFMRKTLPFVVQDNAAEHSISSLFLSTDDFSKWRTEAESFFVTNPTTGYQSEVYYRDFDWIRRVHRNYTIQNQQPTHWSFNPATLALMVYPKSDVVRNATIDYYRSPQILSANSDTPHIRAEWHDIIAAKALSTFALGKGLGSLHMRYENEYARRVGELYRAFVPARTITIRPAA